MKSVKIRSFVVDYKDKGGNDFNKEFYVPELGRTVEDHILILAFTEDIRADDGQGCIIMAITEITGHTYKELTKKRDAGDQVEKYIRFVYLNHSAIRKTMAN
ncbi:hypothetical protein LNN31_00540 [Acetobacterium wieringae]|uniref:Uncharacterized protein n=1 Tax=Acetobacterium wieringae TaxID=52694 RepID=A0ABY6HFA0_9FIRM|nr:hypothetical protein [Acetobacterium wieringae]UYO62970.1 hypothetical protein LNN31_00540 [Acetobacterium wieringae]VUZ26892.1 Uncharacterised protein [Acetobacterium wieringae]